MPVLWTIAKERCMLMRHWDSDYYWFLVMAAFIMICAGSLGGCVCMPRERYRTVLDEKYREGYFACQVDNAKKLLYQYREKKK